MNLPPARSNPQRPDAALLRWAYAAGIFPMADPDGGGIQWYSPDPRGILPLDDRFTVPDSLQRIVRRGDFEIRHDADFPAVIRRCAAPRSDDEATWIDDRIIAAYTELHRAGDAHSVEAYNRGELVGGLYGVHLGSAFFGESMFTLPGPPEQGGGTNASKVCLVHLVNHLCERGFTLLDTQFWNPHLAQFGCVEISREQYEAQLSKALEQPITWAQDSTPA